MLFVCPKDAGHLFQAESWVTWIKVIPFSILLELGKSMALTRYIDQMTSSNNFLLLVSVTMLLTDAQFYSCLQLSMGQN